jgi:exodeoxyribonuclease III
VRDFMVLCLYVPNGQSVGSPKYRYKLDWYRRLRAFLDAKYSVTEKVAMVGDFNVALEDRDVHDPALWHERILCSTPERSALRTAMAFGLCDLLREHHQEAGIYTWWDYRTGGASMDRGLRIDYIMTTPPATAACRSIVVHKELRAAKSPSDHVPVTAEFAD